MIKEISRSYVDVFGNSSEDYFANPFDRHTLNITLKVDISIKSGNTTTINRVHEPSANAAINIFGIDPKEQGFKVGDIVHFKAWKTQDPSDTEQQFFTISFINSDSIEFTTPWGGKFINNAMPDYECSYKLTVANPGATAKHTYCEIKFNQTQLDNDSFESLIDGNTTTYIGALPTSLGEENLLDAAGKQSGQYVEAVYIRLESINDFLLGNDRTYSIKVVFLQSGIRNEVDFQGAGCLKNVFEAKFYRNQNEISRFQKYTHISTSSTGYLDEPYNGQFPNTKFTGTNLTKLAYNKATTFNAVVEVDNVSKVQIGCAWLPFTESIYTDKLELHQGYHSVCTNMVQVIDLNQASAPTIFVNYTSPVSKVDFDLEMLSFVKNNDLVTFNLKFTPTDGFDELLDGDRNMVIFIKAGNVTHTVFNGEMVRVIDVNMPLVTSFLSLQDWTENTFPAIQQQNIFINTQDLFALCARIPFAPNVTWNGWRISVIAKKYDMVMGSKVYSDSFVIQEQYFDISALPINSSGQYIMDISGDSGLNLDSTFQKSNFYIKNDLNSDTVEIYFPMVAGYKKWEVNPNAHPDFLPDRNRNYWHYITSGTEPWDLFIRLVLENDDQGYFKELQLAVDDYNFDLEINKTLYLRRADGTLLTGDIEVNSILELEIEFVTPSMSLDDMQAEISCWVNRGELSTISSVINSDNYPKGRLKPLQSENKLKVEMLPSHQGFKARCLLDTNGVTTADDITITGKCRVNGHESSFGFGIVTENHEGIVTEDYESLITESND
ncbi:MAG: hypothetical protein VKN72_11830 [Nostocales cyanobacterium 94392]|nr:hypothetical protein [Nostocales cyanobacterium 94392]